MTPEMMTQLQGIIREQNKQDLNYVTYIEKNNRRVVTRLVNTGSIVATLTFREAGAKIVDLNYRVKSGEWVEEPPADTKPAPKKKTTTRTKKAEE